MEIIFYFIICVDFFKIFQLIFYFYQKFYFFLPLDILVNCSQFLFHLRQYLYQYLVKKYYQLIFIFYFYYFILKYFQILYQKYFLEFFFIIFYHLY